MRHQLVKRNCDFVDERSKCYEYAKANTFRLAVAILSSVMRLNSN